MLEYVVDEREPRWLRDEMGQLPYFYCITTLRPTLIRHSTKEGDNWFTLDKP